jgi:peptide chain release factor subunit 3
MEKFHLESASAIFIGHVDAGKSSLTGNIMKWQGLVDEQELTRNKQEAKQNHVESWELAYIPDCDLNERTKGNTIECSKMMFNL